MGDIADGLGPVPREEAFGVKPIRDLAVKHGTLKYRGKASRITSNDSTTGDWTYLDHCGQSEFALVDLVFACLAR